MQGKQYFCFKNLAPFAENPMYKKNQNRQITLKDFNQPLGLKLDPENKWIKKAAMIPWEAIEKEYADLFPSGCGMINIIILISIISLQILQVLNCRFCRS